MPDYSGELRILIPEYNSVVFFVVGHFFLPQRVYTAPPVTPPDFPVLPRNPGGPGRPCLPGEPVDRRGYVMLTAP